MTWYAESVTAPATASAAPVSEAALRRPVGERDAGGAGERDGHRHQDGGVAVSPSTSRENARVNRGAVFTSRTEAATDV